MAKPPGRSIWIQLLHNSISATCCSNGQFGFSKKQRFNRAEVIGSYAVKVRVADRDTPRKSEVGATQQLILCGQPAVSIDSDISDKGKRAAPFEGSSQSRRWRFVQTALPARLEFRRYQK